MAGEEPSWEKDYKKVCKEDSDVKNFHDHLEAEIEGVINASAEGGLSMDFLRKVTLCLAETDKRFKNFIVENKKDIWKDRNLRELVGLYEQLNTMTSSFYTELNNCLGKMKGNLCLLQVALHSITPANPPPGKAQYSKCKEKLEEFLAAENSFNEGFSELLKSAHVQHEQILEKLDAKKKKLDKTLKCVRACRKIFYIIFAAVSASLFICGVVAGTMVSAPLGLIVLTALSNPISSAVLWFSSKLANCEKSIKVKCGVVDLMQKRNYGGLYELNQMKGSVERLESSIDLILDSVDLYYKDEANQQDAVENIREEEQRIEDQIHVLSATVDFIREKPPSDEEQTSIPKAVVENIRKKRQIFEDEPNTQNVEVEDIIKQYFEGRTSNQNTLVKDIMKNQEGFEDRTNIQSTVVEDMSEKQQSLEDQTSVQNTTIMKDTTEIQQGFEDQTNTQKAAVLCVTKKRQSFEDEKAVVEDISEKEQRLFEENQNNLQSARVEDIMKKHKSFQDQSNIDKVVVMMKYRSFQDQTMAVVEDLLKKWQSFKDEITELSSHLNRCGQEIQNNSFLVIFKNIRA